MLISFTLWMFMNLMVAIGVAFLAGSLKAREPAPGGYPWRAVASACVMAIFCMLFPWVLAPGQNLDLRMAPMTLLALTEGWDKAVPVGLVIIAYRVATAGLFAAGTLRSALWIPLAIAVLPFFDRRPRTVMRLTAVGLVHAFIGWSLSFVPALSAPLGPGSSYWPVFTVIIVVSLLLLNLALEHVREKQRLQEKLQAELRAKAAVLQLLPYGVVFLDAERRVTERNEAARRLLAADQLPPEWLAYPEVEQALRRHRRISGCRISYAAQDGVERIVILSAVPLPSGGAVLGIQNVTGVIEEEREEARRDRLELLGRLAAAAAHEIKNPLTTIKGFLQLLAPRPEFETHRELMNLVRGEVEQINRVVTGFLGLAGAHPLVISRLPLDDLLYEVVATAQVQFPESAVEVRFEGTPAIEVEADATALKQILRNLTTNAFEAMPSGGMLVLGRENTAAGVRVTVSDTGTGIAPDMLRSVFTPYMTTKATGTGLGLVISKKLATDMGGELDVSSELGKGSVFALTLPSPSAR